MSHHEIEERKRAARMASALLHERLKDLRKAKDLSTYEIGKLLGIHRTAYGYWEKGRSIPSLGDIEVLALVLDSTPQFIAFGVGSARGGSEASEHRKRYARFLLKEDVFDQEALKAIRNAA